MLGRGVAIMLNTTPTPFSSGTQFPTAPVPLSIHNQKGSEKRSFSFTIHKHILSIVSFFENELLMVLRNDFVILSVAPPYHSD